MILRTKKFINPKAGCSFFTIFLSRTGLGSRSGLGSLCSVFSKIKSYESFSDMERPLGPFVNYGDSIIGVFDPFFDKFSKVG